MAGSLSRKTRSAAREVGYGRVVLTAEIIGVGTELLFGETLDTNTAELARELEPFALSVHRTLRVADHLAPLVREIRQAWEGARLIVTSGGLGPTPDDITREAVAQALEEPLLLDEEMLAWIEGRFRERGRLMPEANRKQAFKIPSARWIPNPLGTAPGWWVRREGKDLVVLPGPPGEWRPMWNAILPQLDLPPAPFSKVILKTSGLGESQIVELLGPLFARDEGLEVGTYARVHGVDIVVRGESPRVEEFAQAIRARLGGAIWGEGGLTLPALILERLAPERSLATLESLTGGLLASLLVEVPGASRVFRGGGIAYTPAAKEAFGVDPSIVQRGTVTAECAEAMAEAARQRFESTYGLATTGVAGPEPLEGHPPGTVFLGLSGPEGPKSQLVRLSGARNQIRGRAAYAALHLLLQHL
jgi:nicotinamide-nucleotide amidase